MNLVRSIISAFLLVLLAVCVAGWFWAADLPSAKMAGARFVLALCGLSAVGCIALIWKARQPQVS